MSNGALEAEFRLINRILVFITISPNFGERFREELLPIIGDDIEALLRATVTHRVLIEIFKKTGVKKELTYQIITGGITDFINMLNRKRQTLKKESKLEAEQSVAVIKFDSENTCVVTSDYVVLEKANKDCFIRMEGKHFRNITMNLEKLIKQSQKLSRKKLENNL